MVAMSRDLHRPVYRDTVTTYPVQVGMSPVVALRRAVGRTLHLVARAVRRQLAAVMRQVALTVEPAGVQQGEEDGLEMQPMRTLVGRSVQVDRAEEVLRSTPVRRHSWPRCSLTR